MKPLKRKPTESFEELQAKWYGRLKEFGFEDIEDTSDPDRKLIDWHSVMFRRHRSRLKQEANERYFKKIDEFMNREDLDEICGLIVNHGNSVLTKKKVKKVLELHSGGLSERKIAKKIKRSKKVVHLALKKAREWMKVA